MTSNDNFVTIEIFNARMDRLEAIVEKNVAFMQKENAEFKTQIQDNMNIFKEEIRNDIANFKKEVHEGFERTNAEIGVLQRDVEGIKHDVTGLYHWDYWLLSIILVLFAMPQIVAGIKSLFGAISDGIAGILDLFKH